MNIRDLRYLVAIADHQHFGKAADACFISQPGLSMQIKKLEETLGVQLIERTTKSAILTEIGQVVTKQARDILSQVDSLKALAHEARDPLSGELHLGIIPTVAPYLLPHITPHLTKHFPKLSIYLREDRTENLIQQLKDGKLDGAIFGLPLADNEFMSLPLYEEELVLATSIHHPLKKRKLLHQIDLDKTELLLLEDGHCLRDQALAICAKANASVKKSFQATSLETLRYMIASNVGATLMPKLACHEHQNIHYLAFQSPKPTRVIGMIWRKSSTKQILLHNMIEQIRALMTKQPVKVLHTPLICQKK